MTQEFFVFNAKSGIFARCPIRGLLLLLVACVSAVGQAQINVASRLSTHRYIYTHGGDGDVHNGDVTATWGALIESDSMHTTFFDATSGTFAGHSWDTSVSADILQSYAMTGVVTNASRIVNSSTTSLASTAIGDIAVAGIQSTNPGNELVFNFSALSAQGYHLTGNLIGGSTAFSYVALQKFNGFNWEYLFASFFISGTDVAWDVAGSLETGVDYRLISVLDDGVGGNQAHGKTLSYDFAVVPEPATLAVLAAGLLALRRRRK